MQLHGTTLAKPLKPDAEAQSQSIRLVSFESDARDTKKGTVLGTGGPKGYNPLSGCTGEGLRSDGQLLQSPSEHASDHDS